MSRLDITIVDDIIYKYNTWIEHIQNHQDDLDWIIWVLGNQSHLLETRHGGIGLGLLLVVHSHCGHVVIAVNIDLQTRKIISGQFLASQTYLEDILFLVRRATLECLCEYWRSPPSLAAELSQS